MLAWQHVICLNANFYKAIIAAELGRTSASQEFKVYTDLMMNMANADWLADQDIVSLLDKNLKMLKAWLRMSAMVRPRSTSV